MEQKLSNGIQQLSSKNNVNLSLAIERMEMVVISKMNQKKDVKYIEKQEMRTDQKNIVFSCECEKLGEGNK